MLNSKPEEACRFEWLAVILLRYLYNNEAGNHAVDRRGPMILDGSRYLSPIV